MIIWFFNLQEKEKTSYACLKKTNFPNEISFLELLEKNIFSGQTYFLYLPEKLVSCT